MPWSDFKEAVDKAVQCIAGSFDDEFYASIWEVFDKTSDGILLSQIGDSTSHPDTLDTSAEKASHS